MPVVNVTNARITAPKPRLTVEERMLQLARGDVMIREVRYKRRGRGETIVWFLTLFASYPSRDLPFPSRDREGANVASAFPSRDRKGANVASAFPSRERLPVRARTQTGKGANVASALPSRDRLPFTSRSDVKGEGANVARRRSAASCRARLGLEKVHYL